MRKEKLPLNLRNALTGSAGRKDCAHTLQRTMHTNQRMYITQPNKREKKLIYKRKLIPKRKVVKKTLTTVIVIRKHTCYHVKVTLRKTLERNGS